MSNILELPAQETTTDNRPRDQILIQNLVLDASIGLFDHEQESQQPVIFNLTIDLAPLQDAQDYSVSNIVRYDHLISDIKAYLKEGHVDLIETMAEEVAQRMLAYPRVEQVSVQLYKPEAVEEAGSIGIRITRPR